MADSKSVPSITGNAEQSHAGAKLIGFGIADELNAAGCWQKRKRRARFTEGAAGNATLQYSKGYLTMRWAASDPNGDPLVFKVEIRSKDGSTWQLLKDKLQDHFYSFDTDAFPDGDYVLRVTASDVPDNTPQTALTSYMDSDAFTIDNTPPEIVDVSENGGSVKFTAKDALSWVAKAEYSVNGGEWTLLDPIGKVTDSQVLQFQVAAKPGELLAVAYLMRTTTSLSNSSAASK